jgi:hypothetical protein
MNPVLELYVVGAVASGFLAGSLVYRFTRADQPHSGHVIPDPALIVFWVLVTVLWPFALFIGGAAVIVDTNLQYAKQGEGDEESGAEA